MSILDVFITAETEKAAAEKLVEPAKYQNLEKALKVWMNAWPNGETDTDFLRASGMSFLCPREFVLNYWQPKPNKKFDWASQLKMSTGTHLHYFLQNSVLGPMGVLHGTWRKLAGTVDEEDQPLEHQRQGFHPDPEKAVRDLVDQKPQEWEFVEQSCWDEKYRISGHTDGTLDVQRVQWLLDNQPLFKKNPGEMCKRLHDLPKSTEEALLEIKSVSRFQYNKIETAMDIPEYYRLQATLYQKMTGIPRTLFWYIERDTMTSKTFVYEGEEGWWIDATRKARIVWESIRDEKLPDVFRACVRSSDKRAKACVHGGPCWLERMDFSLYVEQGKRLAAKSGRALLDLSDLKFD